MSSCRCFRRGRLHTSLILDSSLDLPLCVSSGQVFRWDRQEDGSWLGVDGDAWFHVEIDGPEHRVASNGDKQRFVSLFRMDEDLESYKRAILHAAPELEPFVRSFPGLRLMRPSNVVEETFCFLCTANNNLPRILKMVRGMARYGEVMTRFGQENLYRFPSLDLIAGLPEPELRALGFGYRAATIPAIARQMGDRGGEPWLIGLKDRTYHDAHAELVSIKGIGPKLADCICLFALHHTEAVPVDTHLWQAAVRHYFPEWRGKALTEQRYRAVGDHFRQRFGKLAGWAHQYLFYDNMKNWRTYNKG